MGTKTIELRELSTDTRRIIEKYKSSKDPRVLHFLSVLMVLNGTVDHDNTDRLLELAHDARVFDQMFCRDSITA